MKVEINCCCGNENLKNISNYEWFYCDKCDDKYHVSQLYIEELEYKHISEYYKGKTGLSIEKQKELVKNFSVDEIAAETNRRLRLEGEF